jgi:hypothetical protein
MDVTLYPDEDWTVDAYHAPDVSAITLTAPGEGQSVRIEAAYSVLAEIARRWAHELGVEADANGRFHGLGTLDAIDAKIENLETILSGYHAEKGEERRYPDDFQPGDWAQFPPKKTWRKIDRVAENLSRTNRVVWFTYGGKEYGQDARPETRYPYMTSAAMAAVPEQEAR